MQRLLLSGVLPVSNEQELVRTAQMLDPLRLFHHLQALQQALLHSTPIFSSDAEGARFVAALPFCVQKCIGKPHRAALERVEGLWREEGIREGVADPVSSRMQEHEVEPHASSACSSFQRPMDERSFPTQRSAEQVSKRSPAAVTSLTVQEAAISSSGQQQVFQVPPDLQLPHHNPLALTLEHAVHDYLEDQRRHHRRPKTLEWHRKSLSLFLSYLQMEHTCVLLDQMTQPRTRGWFAWLPQSPSITSRPRSSTTVESYARSARAFCQWLVRHRYLSATPFAHLPLPKGKSRLLDLLEPDEWERLLLACRPHKETGAQGERATARNRALLWMLFETGMRATEVCALRLEDVDCEQGIVRVRGKGTAVRRLTLGQEGLYHLLVYLERYRPRAAVCEARTEEDALFLSEAGGPLTKSGIALIFGRIRRRAGIRRKAVSPVQLRENFAMRYLRTGGDLDTLGELLGQKESALFQHYVQMSEEGMTHSSEASTSARRKAGGSL